NSVSFSSSQPECISINSVVLSSICLSWNVMVQSFPQSKLKLSLGFSSITLHGDAPYSPAYSVNSLPNLASKSFSIHQEVIPSDVRMACQTLSLLALSITTFSICGILLLLFIYDTSVFDVTPFSVIFSIVILFKYIILLSKTILFPYYYSIYK